MNFSDSPQLLHYMRRVHKHRDAPPIYHTVIKTDSKAKAIGHGVKITLRPWLYFYET